VVEVEHRPLGTLEHDVLAGRPGLVQQLRRVGDVGPQTLGVADVVLQDLLRLIASRS
jgi:hypothetical protein